MKAPRVTCSEAEWQAFVCDCLDLAGWKWHHEFDSRKSPSGFPDLFAAHPKRGLIVVELKTEKGKLRPEQEEWWRLLSIVSGLKELGGSPSPYGGRRSSPAFYTGIWRPSMWRTVLDVTGVSSMVENVA